MKAFEQKFRSLQRISAATQREAAVFLAKGLSSRDKNKA